MSTCVCAVSADSFASFGAQDLQLLVGVVGTRTSRRCPCSSSGRCARGSGPPRRRWSPRGPAGSRTCAPAACPRRRTAGGAGAGTPASRPGCRRRTSSRGAARWPPAAGCTASATSSRYCLLERRMVNHGGNWNSSTPELAGVHQRIERGQETDPDVLVRLRRQVVRVDVLLVGLRAQVLVELGRLGRVPGQQAESLDVEQEMRRGPLGPQRRGRLGRRRVVGGVDLDQRELAWRSRPAASPACPPSAGTSRRRAGSCPSRTRYRPGSSPTSPKLRWTPCPCRVPCWSSTSARSTPS